MGDRTAMFFLPAGSLLSIPTQVFFDKTGKEVFRHAGFHQVEIEKHLANMGAK